MGLKIGVLKMRTAVFFTFILLTSLPAQQIITIEDAIRIGLKNNFDIQIARNEAEIAENNTGLGTAGFLPTIDAAGNVQYLDSRQDTNSPFSFGNSQTTGYNAEILLNWTLFDGLRMFVNKSRFDRLAELGDALSRNIIENNVVQILAAYFDLVQQEQLLDVAISNLEISETRLNKEKVRRDVGGASSTDFLNAQVSFNNDKAALINQELAVKVALQDLNILLGQKPETDLEVEKNITLFTLEYSLEELLQMTLDRNSTLTAARQSKEISEQDIRLARSYFSPNIFLGGSYTYSDRTLSGSDRFEGDINSTLKDGFIGLNLSWNLFNGFRDKISLENARIFNKNQNLALRDTQNQLEGLVRQKFQTFQVRMELVELEQQNVIAAEQNLMLQQDRYQIGSATFLEFRDAQLNLARAQVTLIAARFQARITRLEIEQLIGNLQIS
jgi:outer membrane protein TolC